MGQRGEERGWGEVMVKRNLRSMEVTRFEERGECLRVEKWRKHVKHEMKEKRF